MGFREVRQTREASVVNDGAKEGEGLTEMVEVGLL